MSHSTISIILLVLCIQCVIISAAEKRLVCYYTNWAQYRKCGKFMPENIDANLCTHIIFSFAKLEGGKIKNFEWNDLSEEWAKGLYQKVLDLKIMNPSLKVLLAIGGWNMGSTDFSNMAATSESRKVFIDSVLELFKKYKFDGLDYDWEYPANREGSKPSDREAFSALVKETKQAFASHKLLVTAAVAAGKKVIDTAYDIPSLSNNLDFINLMAYDLHGSWENFLGHNAPLYSRQDETGDQKLLNVDSAVKYWISKGAPRDKLNVGLATYGRSFNLPSASQTTMGSSANAAVALGKCTKEKGFLAYYEVCENLKNGWKKEWSEEQQVPYAYNDNQWVGYDDVDSINQKAAYINKENLGGGMFWTLDLDDFNGTVCGQGKYPLINAAKKVLKSGSTAPVTTQSQVKVSVSYTSTSSRSNSDGTSTVGSTKLSRKIVSHNRCTKEGFFADVSSNCQKYYRCVAAGSGFTKYDFECPTSLMFDNSISSCNHADVVNCQ